MGIIRKEVYSHLIKQVHVVPHWSTYTNQSLWFYSSGGLYHN